MSYGCTCSTKSVAGIDRAAGLEHERAQSALGELLGGPAAADAGADDDRVVRLLSAQSLASPPARTNAQWRVAARSDPESRVPQHLTLHALAREVAVHHESLEPRVAAHGRRRRDWPAARAHPSRGARRSAASVANERALQLDRPARRSPRAPALNSSPLLRRIVLVAQSRRRTPARPRRRRRACRCAEAACRPAPGRAVRMPPAARHVVAVVGPRRRDATPQLAGLHAAREEGQRHRRGSGTDQVATVHGNGQGGAAPEGSGPRGIVTPCRSARPQSTPTYDNRVAPAPENRSGRERAPRAGSARHDSWSRPRAEHRDHPDYPCPDAQLLLARRVADLQDHAVLAGGGTAEPPPNPPKPPVRQPTA